MLQVVSGGKQILSQSWACKVLIKECPGLCTRGREKREQDGQSRGELSDWNDPSDFFQVGLKQSDLCAPVLISYWMWATFGVGGSLKLRQSLKELTSERCLLIALLAYGANPSLKSVWVVHHSDGHRGRQGPLL